MSLFYFWAMAHLGCLFHHLWNGEEGVLKSPWSPTAALFNVEFTMTGEKNSPWQIIEIREQSKPCSYTSSLSPCVLQGNIPWVLLFIDFYCTSSLFLACFDILFLSLQNITHVVWILHFLLEDFNIVGLINSLWALDTWVLFWQLVCTMITLFRLQKRSSQCCFLGQVCICIP